MKFELENIIKDDFTDSLIDSLIEEYTLCVDRRDIKGHEIELWCYDDDLTRLFTDSGIGIGKSTDVKKEFKYDEDYEPIGLEYGDYIETVELHQNGNTYLVPVYCAYNGSGADYAFAIFEAEKEEKKIYAIRVTETLARTIAVKANSLNDAIQLINEAYDAEEIVLDYRDYDEYDISPSPYVNEDGTITEENAEYYEKLNF